MLHLILSFIAGAVVCRLLCLFMLQKNRAETTASFETLLEFTDDPMIIVDTQRHIAAANGASAKLFGHKQEELIGKCIDDMVISGDIMNQEDSSYINLEAEREGYEVFISKKNDSYFKACASSRIVNVGGKKYAALMLNPAENRLINDIQENCYKLTIDHATEGILWVNQKGLVTYANETALKMLSYQYDELMKVKTANLSEELTNWSEIVSLADQYGDCVFETNMITKETNLLPVEVKVKHMGIYNNNYTCLFIRNVSIRRQEDKQIADYSLQLERKNEELEQFAYIASHSLQEPLRMIGSFVQLLNQRYKGQLDKEADDFISFVVDGVQKMQALLRDLAYYSNISLKVKSFSMVNMEDIIKISLDKLKFQLEDSQAKITFDALPMVRGNQMELLQLMKNLIGNAIQYKGESTPQIHISAEKTDIFWRFSVKDNGIGVEPEFEDQIFRIFNRLHQSEDYKGGNGMGLAICQKIIEKHGGQIWLKSNPDKGSIFYFTLPIPAENYNTVYYGKTA